MASKKTVTIQILDQNIVLTTDAPPERIEKISSLVSKSLHTALVQSKNVSPYHAALLAALNIAEKYFETIEKEVAFKTRISQKSKKILALLETTGSDAG